MEAFIHNRSGADTGRRSRERALAFAAFLVLAVASHAQTYRRWTDKDHRYAVVLPALGKEWEDATLDAQARGGYLVPFASAEENAVVANLLDNPSYGVSQFGSWNFGLYTGLFHPDAPGPNITDRRWVTGEPADYANGDFCSREPNDAGGRENYAHFHAPGGTRQGYWNDLDPNYEIQPNGDVIERAARPTQSPTRPLNDAFQPQMAFEQP